jgi:hypothetical protein
MELKNEICWQIVKLSNLVNTLITTFERVRLVFSSNIYVNCGPPLHRDLSDAQHSGKFRIIAPETAILIILTTYVSPADAFLDNYMTQAMETFPS